MPKMLIAAMLTSGVLAGAAVTYLALGRRAIAALADGEPSLVARARTLGANARDALRSVPWAGRRPADPVNSAFEQYRAEALGRLAQEQRQFDEYMRKLRHAKDQAEFDAFMAAREPNPDAVKEPARDSSPAPGKRAGD